MLCRSCSSRLGHSPDVSAFFFSCSGDHRDLHSFPTRRSSDLRAGHIMLPAPRRKAVPRWRTPPAVGVLAVRSEEHTSELQSPYDLVCRLLLEKKKKQIKQLKNIKLKDPTVALISN